MKYNYITDIFFDLDHTLWDFDKNSELAFDKIFKINKIDIELTKFLEVYVPANLRYWKLFRENKIDKETLRFKRLNEVFLQLGKSFDRNMILKLSEDYITYLSTFDHLFDGTIEILEYLKPNYNLHIITNGFQEVQHKKIKNSKIDHFFNTITNSEMVGVKKPDPKIFNHALQLAKTKPEKSIMIGDNYEADILGALNIGLDAICFNYHNEDLNDDIKQISHLTSLKEYF